LLAWTVDAALASGLDRVILSTDSESIAGLGRELGAEVPFMRPAALADDGAKSIDVVLHALDLLEGQPDAVMLLQPTSPFRSVGDIDGAIGMMRTSRPHSVIGVVAATQHPVQMRVLKEGRIERAPFSGVEGTPRQELAHYVIPNGSIYLTRVDVLVSRSFYGTDSLGWVMPPERSLNIDHPFDLEVARALAAVAPGERAAPG
jgi:CMP-N-acetylneuraminic acid synthetase